MLVFVHSKTWKNFCNTYMIKRLVFTILINAAILLLVQYVLGDDKFSISPTWGFLAVGMVMGFLNFVVKPILSLLSLPIMLITFGLFLSVINVAMLYFNVYLFEEIFTIGVDFTISGGIITYAFASFLLSVFNSLFHFFIRVK